MADREKRMSTVSKFLTRRTKPKERPAIPRFSTIDPSSTVDQSTGIDSLSQDTVNAQIEQYFDDMCLSAEARTAIRTMTVDQKRQILKHHSKNTASDDSQQIVEQLNTTKTTKELNPILKTLSVKLGASPLSWIERFAQFGGLPALSHCLNQSLAEYFDLHNSAHRRESEMNVSEIVKCLRKFANTKPGFKELVNDKIWLIALCQCLFLPDETMLIDALNLAAVFVLTADGLSRVLTALTIAAETRQESLRFQSIVRLCNFSKSGMQLINAACLLITSLMKACGEENFELRFHLRLELSRCGFDNFLPQWEKHYLEWEPRIEELKLHSGQERPNHAVLVPIQLANQYNTYAEQCEDDIAEFQERQQIIFDNYNTVAGCVEMLESAVKGTPTNDVLVSILQHLLMLPHDKRHLLLSMIESLVGQVVLQRSGADPDARYRLFDFDQEEIYRHVAEEAILEANREHQKEVDELKEQLSTGKLSLQDKETELKALYTKIDQLKQQLASQNVQTSPLRSQIDAIASQPGPHNAALAPPPPPAPSLGPPGAPAPPPAPPLGKIPGAPPAPPIPGAPPAPPVPGAPPAPPIPGAPRIPGAPPMAPGLPGPAKLPFNMKPKKKYDQTGERRRVNVPKIEIRDIQSGNEFWVKVDETTLETNLFREHVRRFAFKQPKQRRLDSAADSEAVDGNETGDRPPTDSPVAGRRQPAFQLIDGKQALTIQLTTMSKQVPIEKLREAIETFDESLLDAEVCQRLINDIYERFADQIIALRKRYQLEELAAAEQALWVLGGIKRGRQRLEALELKQTYEAQIAEVRPQILRLTSVLRAIRESRPFHELLNLVLLFINMVNAGSRNQQLVGIPLSALPKLSQTRDINSNEQTLVDFLVEYSSESKLKAFDWTGDLAGLANAASLEQINATMDPLRKQVRKLKTDFDNTKKAGGDASFVEAVRETATKASSQFEELDGLYKAMFEEYEKTVVFYSMKPAKYSMDDLLNDLKTFYNQFTTAKKMLADREEKARQQKAANERAEKVKAEKLERERQRKLVSANRANNENKQPGGSGTKKQSSYVDLDQFDDDQKNLLDDMIFNIAGNTYGMDAGEASKRRRRRRPNAAAMLNRSRSRAGLQDLPNGMPMASGVGGSSAEPGQVIGRRVAKRYAATAGDH